MSEDRIEELRARNHDLANQVMQERAKLMQAEANNEAIHRQLEQAVASAAALRRALEILTRVGSVDSARSVSAAMLQRVDAGASLLAELETARADNAVLRYLLTESINFRQHCRLCKRAAPDHEPSCPLAGEHPSAALLAVAEAAAAFVEARPEYDDIASLLLELKEAVKGWKR